MKETIALLIEAASDHNENPCDTSGTIGDMLQKFAVGTEKRKKTNVGVFPIDELGPLRNVKKQPVIHKAATALQLLSMGIPNKKQRRLCNNQNENNDSCKSIISFPSMIIIVKKIVGNPIKSRNLMVSSR